MSLFGKKKQPPFPRENPMTTRMVGMGLDFLKHVLKDFEQARSAKKIDKFAEHFSTLEHLVLKIENRVEENRRELEKLRANLVWIFVMNFIVLIAIVFQLLVHFF